MAWPIWDNPQRAWHLQTTHWNAGALLGTTLSRASLTDVEGWEDTSCFKVIGLGRGGRQAASRSTLMPVQAFGPVMSVIILLYFFPQPIANLHCLMNNVLQLSHSIFTARVSLYIRACDYTVQYMGLVLSIADSTTWPAHACPAFASIKR